MRASITFKAFLVGADGKVKGVTVIKGLGSGLSEKAVEAAREVKFTPATVGGRPVSQFVTLEYNFRVF
jgi:protein TonB